MASANSSTNNNKPNFFEGTEKLLEVWFSCKENDNGDLRNIPREDWEALLQEVNCTIVSEMRDDDTISFVLSESSMFITKNRFILKTCGTTTLLMAMNTLLKLVEEKVGSTVEDVFYSRKNYMRPDLQQAVHSSFDREVKILDNHFTDGDAYVLGQMNRECWHLYTLSREGVNQPDQTIELLMWKMDPEKMRLFTKEVCQDGREATKKSGICDILPEAKIDDYLFDPCGYSMNGLIAGGYYITIHVTPEPEYSYVSFESNVPKESYHDLIQRVLEVFRPGVFLMTIFANKASIARDFSQGIKDYQQIAGYQRQLHQFSQFKNYDLTYATFQRPII